MEDERYTIVIRPDTEKVAMLETVLDAYRFESERLKARVQELEEARDVRQRR